MNNTTDKNSINFIDQLLSEDPFLLEADKKDSLFMSAMNESFNHHINNNELFRNYCENQNFSIDSDCDDLHKFPYLPVNIFKTQKLSSIPEDTIKSTLNSSATSGTPSTIVLDAITSKRQTVASAKVMSNFLGIHRRPFMILDEDPSKNNSNEISARSAATRGFLIQSSDSNYFLREINNELSLDIKSFGNVLNDYIDDSKEICIFGFTYILYHNVVKTLKRKDIKFKLPDNSKICHIGGWKKLESEKVSKEQFLNDVSNSFGVNEKSILDFYGFTEQMGLIYANSGSFPKIVSSYSEIIIRDFNSLEPVVDGEEGLIQILTPLPHSYPGISVLTEDVGKIVGRGIDRTGRIGTQFEIIGRAKEAEVRGCGDIMAEYVS